MRKNHCPETRAPASRKTKHFIGIITIIMLVSIGSHSCHETCAHRFIVLSVIMIIIIFIITVIIVIISVCYSMVATILSGMGAGSNTNSNSMSTIISIDIRRTRALVGDG